MATVFAFGVENAEDEHPLAVQEVKKLVRKSWEENSPKASIIKREAIRIYLQGSNGTTYLIQKVATETRLPLVIPIPCFLNILFRARPDNNRPFHGRFRNRASTSGQGVPAWGSFW